VSPWVHPTVVYTNVLELAYSKGISTFAQKPGFMCICCIFPRIQGKKKKGWKKMGEMEMFPTYQENCILYKVQNNLCD